jgi:Glycosyltransferase like family 2
MNRAWPGRAGRAALGRRPGGRARTSAPGGYPSQVTDQISPAGPPSEITHLVRERMEARQRRDWATADALKTQIEALGWKVVDHGGRTSVTPAAPPSLEVEGRLRYGAASAVPSRLDEPATAPFTIVLMASEESAKVARLLDGIGAHAPAGTHVVVVANDPSEAQQTALAALAAGEPAAGSAADSAPGGLAAPEQLRTSTRLGYAAAMNIGLRRAAGEIVVLADGSAWPAGDAFSAIATAFADEAVAVAGGIGFRADEPGRLRPGAMELAVAEAGATASDLVGLQGGWLAFRRSDLAALGPLDEHFVTPAWLDVWWSLRLRCGLDPDWTETDSDAAADGATEAQAAAQSGETPADDAADAPEADQPAMPELPAPRRAVLLGLPLGRDEITWPPDRSRLNRRNMYRILDRYGWRDDLG